MGEKEQEATIAPLPKPPAQRPRQPLVTPLPADTGALSGEQAARERQIASFDKNKPKSSLQRKIKSEIARRARLGGTAETTDPAVVVPLVPRRPKKKMTTAQLQKTLRDVAKTKTHVPRVVNPTLPPATRDPTDQPPVPPGTRGPTDRPPVPRTFPNLVLGGTVSRRPVPPKPRPPRDRTDPGGAQSVMPVPPTVPRGIDNTDLDRLTGDLGGLTVDPTVPRLDDTTVPRRFDTLDPRPQNRRGRRGGDPGGDDPGPVLTTSTTDNSRRHQHIGGPEISTRTDTHRETHTRTDTHRETHQHVRTDGGTGGGGQGGGGTGGSTGPISINLSGGGFGGGGGAVAAASSSGAGASGAGQAAQAAGALLAAVTRGKKKKQSGITAAKRRYTDKRKVKMGELRALKSKRIREHATKTKKLKKADRDKERRAFKTKVNQQFKEVAKRFPTARGLKDLKTVRELTAKLERVRMS